MSRGANRMEHLENKYPGPWVSNPTPRWSSTPWADSGARSMLAFFRRHQCPCGLHTSSIVVSRGNLQPACSATKAGNGFSESYLEILNPFIVVLYYIIFYFITCVGCRGPHSCASAFILSFSTVYFIKTSFLFL